MVAFHFSNYFRDYVSSENVDGDCLDGGKVEHIRWEIVEYISSC